MPEYKLFKTNATDLSKVPRISDCLEYLSQIGLVIYSNDQRIFYKSVKKKKVRLQSVPETINHASVVETGNLSGLSLVILSDDPNFEESLRERKVSKSDLPYLIIEDNYIVLVSREFNGVNEDPLKNKSFDWQTISEALITIGITNSYNLGLLVEEYRTEEFEVIRGHRLKELELLIP